MKFSLVTIGYVFALLAAAMAVFGGPLGIIAWLVVLGYWWLDPRWPKTLLEILVIVMVIGLLLGLLMPTVHTGRESSRVMVCGGNIRSIALALQAYRRMHGHLPPAGVANTHAMSWRVAVLPWLENRDLYEAYRRDEPWNSAANMRVTAQPLWIYECPSDPPVTATTPRTNYFAIVDARTV
ncbi:MAG: DUF1559 domain-containing protein [Pirellulales bacterium]|nr:DUF1559 domain-containing protein [Pirellulales bacterium]